jgi:hypothetical protein
MALWIGDKRLFSTPWTSQVPPSMVPEVDGLFGGFGAVGNFGVLDRP